MLARQLLSDEALTDDERAARRRLIDERRAQAEESPNV
jgi:hypothetical protein